MRRVLFAIALLALGSPAAAQDGPKWGLKDKQRYELDPDRPPNKPPQNKPTIAPFVLLGPEDLEDGRHPKHPIDDPGDLVWHFALRIPPVPLPKGKKPAIVDVEESFKGNQGEIKVHGNQSMRRKGKRFTVRTSLVVTAIDKGHWLQKANLVTGSVFNLKTGLLEEARYTFEVQTTEDGKTRGDTWKGSLRAARPVHVLGADFHEEVDAAISNGVKWLRRETKKRLSGYASRPYSGQMLGRIALPCFALLRSGVSPDELERHFEWMERQPLKETYSAALWIMVLEARSVRREVLPPRGATRSVARYARDVIPKEDLEKMERATRWLVATRKAEAGWWSYHGHPDAGLEKRTEARKGKTGEAATNGPVAHDGVTPAKGGDRSNSQFAVLALHSALASGIEIPKEVWAEVAKEALEHRQDAGPELSLAGSEFRHYSPFARDARDDPDPATMERKKQKSIQEILSGTARGWAYSTTTKSKTDAYGSMSAAGVSTLAIAREGLLHTKQPKRAARALEGLVDGLCWLLDRYDPTRNPRRQNSHYFYFAYSFEKAMDTAGIERLGDREWWRDFAAESLARQEKNGGWKTIEDTSFALLVLNRATLPAKLELGKVERVATGKGGASKWDHVAVEGLEGKKVTLAVRQLLTVMVDSPVKAKERLTLAERAFEALEQDLRPRLLPELIPLLTHPYKPTRKWTEETCLQLGGSTAPAALEAFAARWEVLRKVVAQRDYEQLLLLRVALKNPDAPVALKRPVVEWVGRLRAVEALPELIALLDHEHDGLREEAWGNLISLAGGAHVAYDPASKPKERQAAIAGWKTWLGAEGGALVLRERIRRAMEDLSRPKRAKDAASRLRSIGRPALRALVDGLRNESTKKRSHKLLKQISGQKFPAEVGPWLKWVEKNED